MDSLGSTLLIDKQGQIYTSEDAILSKDLICYYFSASWCPPCRVFLPKLKSLYREAQNRRIPLEVIYVSLDHNQTDMMDHFSSEHGEWLALNYGDDTIEELRLRFGINGIPALVVVRIDGTPVTLNGKVEVEQEGVNILQSWA